MRERRRFCVLVTRLFRTNIAFGRAAPVTGSVLPRSIAATRSLKSSVDSTGRFVNASPFCRPARRTNQRRSRRAWTTAFAHRETLAVCSDSTRNAVPTHSAVAARNLCGSFLDARALRRLPHKLPHFLHVADELQIIVFHVEVRPSFNVRLNPIIHVVPDFARFCYALFPRRQSNLVELHQRPRQIMARADHHEGDERDDRQHFLFSVHCCALNKERVASLCQQRALDQCQFLAARRKRPYSRFVFAAGKSGRVWSGSPFIKVVVVDLLDAVCVLFRNAYAVFDHEFCQTTTIDENYLLM